MASRASWRPRSVDLEAPEAPGGALASPSLHGGGRGEASSETHSPDFRSLQTYTSWPPRCPRCHLSWLKLDSNTPRRPQKRPRLSQDGPRGPQGGPKMAKEASKTPQEGSKRTSQRVPYSNNLQNHAGNMCAPIVMYVYTCLHIYAHLRTQLRTAIRTRV